MDIRPGATDRPVVVYYLIRAIFVLLFTYTSWKLGGLFDPNGHESSVGGLAGIFIGMIGSGLLVAFEAYFSQHYLSLFYSIIAGLLLGLLISVFFVQIIAYIPQEYIENSPVGRDQKAVIGLLIIAICCYLSVVLVLRARGNYRLIIPFVELKQEGPQRKRLILDTSVIVDGRIADICDTLIVDQTIFLPDFVLSEIHAIADSSESVRRERGRRGLDRLNHLRNNPRVAVEMITTNYADEMTTESKLIQLAHDINGRIITTDHSLHQLAQLQRIEVVNLHELENALRPILLVGETRSLRIIRPGEEPDQGIGYLEDGTMVVVRGGRKYVNQEAMVSVTSILMRPTGRMIFAQLEAAPGPVSGSSDDFEADRDAIREASREVTRDRDKDRPRRSGRQKGND